MSFPHRNIASTTCCKLIPVLVLAALGSTAHAEIIGPDSFGYQADTAATFTYEDISATGTRVLDNEDDTAEFAAIGFSFNFYGTPYTDVYFTPNGLLTFNLPDEDFSDDPLLAESGPVAPAIAPLWDDWTAQDFGGPSDAVYYQTLGSSGVDRRFIVQWHQIRHFDNNNETSSGTVDFQLVLFETGVMEFRYLDVDGLVSQNQDSNNGATATIGIRNAPPDAPSNGQVLSVSFDTPNAVVNGQAIRISLANANPPVCDAAAPSSAIVIANDAHSLVPINIAGITDPDGGPVTITVDSIYQDEGVLARGSGKTCPDGGGMGTSTGLIRAERVGDKKILGNGRIYTLGFSATDSNGASCLGTVKVCVPHDTSGHRLCVEDNVVVDSTVCP